MGKYFYDVVIYFAIYSFVGWIIDTSYASIKKGKIINRGFLNGPFCPVYGFAALLLLYSIESLKKIFPDNYLSIPLIVLYAMFITTIVEYGAGYIMEKVFKCKMWNYSHYSFNLHGRVCLKYSIYWGILSYFLIVLLHPPIQRNTALLSSQTKIIVTTSIIIVFTLDTIKSFAELKGLKKIVLEKYTSSIENFYEQIIRYKRIFMAFPRLYFLNVGKLNQEIRENIQNEFKKIKNKLKARKK